MNPLDAIVNDALWALTRAGVKKFEIYAEHSSEAECELMDGRVNFLRRAEERVLAIRVLEGGIGHVGLCEPTRDEIEQGVAVARAEARQARPAAIDDFAAAGEGVQSSTALAFADSRATGTIRPALEEAARALEAAALAADGRLVAVRPASIQEVRAEWRLLTSAGLSVGDTFTRAGAGLGALAESDDDSRLVGADRSALAIEGLDLLGLAKDACTRALRMLGAGPIATGVRAVLLSPRAVAELLPVWVAALDGEQLVQGASFLSGRLGSLTFSSALSLVDQPLDPGLNGATRWDGEGLATRPLTLIDRGLLSACLCDRDGAARLGRPATGHALRGGRGRPSAGAHALVLAPGTVALGALQEQAQLYVDELAGAHTLDPTSGDLSLGASGWRLSGGEWAEPVEGMTIAGSLVGLLSGPIQVSAQVQDLGDCRVPALFLPEVQVASTGTS